MSRWHLEVVLDYFELQSTVEKQPSETEIVKHPRKNGKATIDKATLTTCCLAHSLSEVKLILQHELFAEVQNNLRLLAS